MNNDSSFFAVVNDNTESIQNHTFFFLWITFAIISSCYTLTWDLKMDWGLLDSNAGENRFLREEIVYAYKVTTLQLVYNLSYI